MLHVEGYAAVGPGLFIHPLDLATRVTQAMTSRGFAERILTLRGERLGGLRDEEFARQHWPIAELASKYSRFLREFAPLERLLTRLSDRDAFRYRFATALAFLEIAWDDPGLADELLPPYWPGHEARRLARTLYERLLPRALAHANSLLAQPASDSVSRRQRRTSARSR
jgi:phenylacetic acid degradation operon negative regulatory protein